MFARPLLPDVHHHNLMAPAGLKGTRVYSRCRLQITSLLRWFFLPRAHRSETHKASMQWTKPVSFAVPSFVIVCLCVFFPFVPHAQPLPAEGYRSSRLPVSSFRPLPSLAPRTFHSFSLPGSLASASPTSLRVPFHSAVGRPAFLADHTRFSASPRSLVKGRKRCLSRQAAERSHPRVFSPVTHALQEPLPWRHRARGMSPGAQSYLLSGNVVASFPTSSPCSLKHPRFLKILHNGLSASHEEASGRRLVSQRDRGWVHAGETTPRVPRALFAWSLPSRLSHFEGKDEFACSNQTAVLSRLHAEGGKDVARASEQEAPYPSFIVPSPHPPPPGKGTKASWPHGIRSMQRRGRQSSTESRRVARQSECARTGG